MKNALFFYLDLIFSSVIFLKLTLFLKFIFTFSLGNKIILEELLQYIKTKFDSFLNVESLLL